VILSEPFFVLLLVLHFGAS
jgi:hypothetical protein